MEEHEDWEIREIHRKLRHIHGGFAHWEETYKMCQVIMLEIHEGVPAVKPEGADMKPLGKMIAD